ncbi:MAG TPA: hypothetical protein VG518_02330 [Solirubrobacterales bacterium]|nr:hypothetical protein [Solirubrobacterales bacterium]
MREKLNNDPKLQAIMIGVLLILAAFFFITRMGGGEEEESVPTAATVTETGGEAAVPSETAEPSAEAPVEATAPPAVPSSIDVPPPPAPVRVAYKDDKTVVLLIVHDGGIDDRLVARSVRDLSGVDNVAVFVVPVSQIADYASITLGVEVSRVPALIVMRPRSLSEGTPQASVSYGFQSKQSIVQAVRDAGYDGPPATYHPD